MTAVELTKLFWELVVIAILGGGLTFLATQLVKQEKWPSGVKLALSWAMALAFALATAWKAGDVFAVLNLWHDGITAEAIVSYFVVYWAVATLWYEKVFKGVTWARWLARFPKSE